LILEVHNQPEEALSDGLQSVYLDQFSAMLPKLKQLASLEGRRFDFETNNNLTTEKTVYRPS
jgi:3-deoxy-D-manno-octulosonic acid (KDO) 8-phosphate synthase